MLEYFENGGARTCSPSENPAEYILEVTPGAEWIEKWQSSNLKKEVDDELSQIQTPEVITSTPKNQKYAFSDHEMSDLKGTYYLTSQLTYLVVADDTKPKEFATKKRYQILELTKRLSIVWWRNYPNT